MRVLEGEENMESKKIKIDLLPSNFRKEDGTFDQQEALKLCGKIAGVCYDEEGFSHLENEPEERTMKRIDRTLSNGHHSVYGHVKVHLNIQNIPKILAMVLNNEREYDTSEKSARFTPIVREDDSVISEREERLYQKWLELFKMKITERYGGILSEVRIRRLAQENARYLVTVLMPTQMIYTTSLRQINYLASWMEKYVINAHWVAPMESLSDLESALAYSMEEFYEALDEKNILVDGLMQNEKERSFSLFGKDLQQRKTYFGDVYSTTYLGSFAQFAQVQRYRPNSNQLERLEEKQYFVPPIISDDLALVDEWLGDCALVKDVIPQGELVRINERGTYESFILKCKERLCSGVQLETMLQTRATLLEYQKALQESQHPHGARCTFPDYTCNADCHFKEGKTLTRMI